VANSYYLSDIQEHYTVPPQLPQNKTSQSTIIIKGRL